MVKQTQKNPVWEWSWFGRAQNQYVAGAEGTRLATCAWNRIARARHRRLAI